MKLISQNLAKIQFFLIFLVFGKYYQPTADLMESTSSVEGFGSVNLILRESFKVLKVRGKHVASLPVTSFWSG